jgi:hypothetical protein
MQSAIPIHLQHLVKVQVQMLHGVEVENWLLDRIPDENPQRLKLSITAQHCFMFTLHDAGGEGSQSLGMGLIAGAVQATALVLVGGPAVQLPWAFT